MAYPLWALSIICLLAVLHVAFTDNACVWPNFFDVSVEFGGDLEKLEINSWETNIKIMKKDLKINGVVKQNMWLTVLNNDTIEVTYDTKIRDLDTKRRLHYSCIKGLKDFTYLVKVKRGELDENDTFIEVERSKYKCIQFIKRSPFVLQWRDGPESGDMLECTSGFAPIRPWPLIYFPVRNMPVWDNIKKEHGLIISALLKEYQSCPKLGGFYMQVFDKNGKAVNGNCSDGNPSPRMELECLHGDGIRIISAQTCTSSSVPGIGSKLHCLATWDDGRYQFSVVVPSYRSGINSFHCLRINKEDPTKEHAVLFLDTICGKGELVKSKVSNFQLELRRASINSMCDDTSDQCNTDQCELMAHSCLTTCNACPSNNSVIIDKSIHGIWILQQRGTVRKLNVTENEIELFDVGVFKAYSNGSSESKHCLKDFLPVSDNERTFTYILGGVPINLGCGPRVTTLRAKMAADSILLAQIPAPAPLRANADNINLNHWCHNNYDDINTFGQLFRHIYPFQSTNGAFQNTTGYVTLIREENLYVTECISEDTQKDMTVSASFKSDTGNHDCKGNMQTEDDNKKWRFRLSCSDDNSTDTGFTCLGKYKMDEAHSVTLLKQEDGDRFFNMNQKYYCLIFPTRVSKNSTIIFHNAGECDVVLKSLVEMDIMMPLMKLTVGESSSVRPAANAIVFFPLFIWYAFLKKIL